ncbi:MAG: transcriptional regulator [Chloroflexota bacterium]
MSARTDTTLFVRIIELPAVKMARSGQGDLNAFDRWWSALAAQDKSSLFPKDFLWFNAALGCFEWLYAIPGELEDTGGYEVFDFPGGLYAVAACQDNDAEVEKTNRLIHEWIARSEVFTEETNSGGQNPRYDMGHVITPPQAKEMMGYGQMDLFVPIAYRER